MSRAGTMIDGGGDRRDAADEAAHRLRTAQAINDFYRQAEIVGACQSIAEAALDGGPPWALVYALEDLIYAWAVLEAQLDLTGLVLGTDEDSEARTLATSPVLQQLRAESRAFLARSTVLARVGGASLAVLVRLHRLGVRLLALDLVEGGTSTAAVVPR